MPSYGGNGGISSEHPSIRRWFARTLLECKSDPRVGEIYEETLADTPITMVRNRFVSLARQAGADVLVMCDSDQDPLLYEDDRRLKPFWKDSFDFLYQHYERGPVCVFAPYCGPPPHENVYVFQWANRMALGDESPISLDQYTREESLRMAGIQEAAAGPTGLIMIDLRCFDLLAPPYFHYEWKDEEQTQKASTEDVTFTRDLALVGTVKLGYNPLFCNWDAWIGHWKPWCVGKPRRTNVEEVGQRLRASLLENRTETEKVVEVRNETLLRSVAHAHTHALARAIELECVTPAPNAVETLRKHNGHSRGNGQVDPVTANEAEGDV